jgi:hypothetical protein
LTRDPVADRIGSVTLAALTRTTRDLVSELELTAQRDRIPSDRVANFDNVHHPPASVPSAGGDAFRRPHGGGPPCGPRQRRLLDRSDRCWLWKLDGGPARLKRGRGSRDVVWVVAIGSAVPRQGRVLGANRDVELVALVADRPVESCPSALREHADLGLGPQGGGHSSSAGGPPLPRPSGRSDGSLLAGR